MSLPSSSMAVKHGLRLLSLKKRVQAFKTKCLWKLLSISYVKHETNNWVWSKINFLVGPQEPLTVIKRWKLAWFGHVTYHDSLSKTILRGTLEGGWHCSQRRKCWMDNIKEWTSLPMSEVITVASSRQGWKRTSAESAVMSPWQPNQSEHLLSFTCSYHFQWPWLYFKVTAVSNSFYLKLYSYPIKSNLCMVVNYINRIIPVFLLFFVFKGDNWCVSWFDFNIGFFSGTL